MEERFEFSPDVEAYVFYLYMFLILPYILFTQWGVLLYEYLFGDSLYAIIVFTLYTVVIPFLGPRFVGNLVSTAVCLVRMKRIPKSSELPPWLFRAPSFLLGTIGMRALSLASGAIVLVPFYFLLIMNPLVIFVVIYGVAELLTLLVFVPIRMKPMDAAVDEAVETGKVSNDIYQRIETNREFVLDFAESVGMRVQFQKTPVDRINLKKNSFVVHEGSLVLERGELKRLMLYVYALRFRKVDRMINGAIVTLYPLVLYFILSKLRWNYLSSQNSIVLIAVYIIAILPFFLVSANTWRVAYSTEEYVAQQMGEEYLQAVSKIVEELNKRREHGISIPFIGLSRYYTLNPPTHSLIIHVLDGMA